MLQYLLKNSHFYSLRDGELENWLEVTRCQIEKDRLSVLLSDIPLRLMQPSAVRYPGELTTQVREVINNGGPEPPVVESDTFTNVPESFRQG